VLPCRFLLVAAANPCPCGRGDRDPDCTCAEPEIRRYRGRLSGALADRIDIVCPVERPSAAEIGGGAGEGSAEVRDRVVAARAMQSERLGAGRCNAEMTPGEARGGGLDEAALTFLGRAYERHLLSGRSHDRVLRLARTVADLAGEDEVGEEHVAAALQLRLREDR
jgi:magnesium chelatase family protein